VQARSHGTAILTSATLSSSSCGKTETEGRPMQLAGTVLAGLAFLIAAAVFLQLVALRGSTHALADRLQEHDQLPPQNLARIEARFEEIRTVVAGVTAGVGDLRTEFNKYISYSDRAGNASATQEPADLSADIILAELSHALKSPLLTVKTAADKVARSVAVDMNERAAQGLRDIQNSAQECDHALAIFQQIVDVSIDAEQDRFLTLADAITYLHGSADRVHQRETRLVVSVPDEVPEFSQSFLITLLRPLVENAVEASPMNADIVVIVKDENGAVMVSVGNMVDGPVNRDALQKRGVSTKGDGHKGLGLSVARRLAAISGGSLSIEFQVDRVVINVGLLRRPS
jgi:signal transduction histidine kinase